MHFLTQNRKLPQKLAVIIFFPQRSVQVQQQTSGAVSLFMGKHFQICLGMLAHILPVALTLSHQRFINIFLLAFLSGVRLMAAHHRSSRIRGNAVISALPGFIFLQWNPFQMIIPHKLRLFPEKFCALLRIFIQPAVNFLRGQNRYFLRQMRQRPFQGRIPLQFHTFQIQIQNRLLHRQICGQIPALPIQFFILKRMTENAV